MSASSHKKLFVVKYYDDLDNDATLMKAFSGHLSAKCYVEDEAKRLMDNAFKAENCCWIDAWHYECINGIAGPSCKFEIEEIEVEQDVVLPELPHIENENLALKAENIELREKLAHCNGAISSALQFLTMWDGGWEYEKEHVLENMHKAKALLEECMPRVQSK